MAEQPVEFGVGDMRHPRAVIAWAVYLSFLAIFVALGLRDPDKQRRAAVWPMAASFCGLAALAVARTLFTDTGSLDVGPWIAWWLLVAALIATAGRPVRLAIGTPLDPRLRTATDQERRTAKRTRLLTLLIFAGGLAIGAVVRPDVFSLWLQS